MEPINEANDRVIFCIKLWMKELKEEPLKSNDWTEKGMIMHIENEILTGEYCSDDEYKHYKRWGN